MCLVWSDGFGKHLNRFNVFPRVWRTDLTQMAIALDSRFLEERSCFRVLRTFLIQEQSLDPNIFYLDIRKGLDQVGKTGVLTHL